jgi:hypothetical protein
MFTILKYSASLPHTTYNRTAAEQHAWTNSNQLKKIPSYQKIKLGNENNVPMMFGIEETYAVDWLT